MNPGELLLTVAGLLIAAGLVSVVAAVRGVSFMPPRSASGARSTLLITPAHLVALAVGVIVLLITGWPVAAIAAAAGVVFVPQVLGGGKAAKQMIVRSEALADWTRRLADLISSGASGSTRDALRRSLTSVPDAVAPEVNRLVRRMGPQGTEFALRQFAREVDDPAAEKIAGVLLLRDRNGGPGLADALTDLAQALDERSRMVREVESERAKPRSNMRFIIIITAALMAGMMLFARPFLTSYSTVLGQFLLVGVAAIFAVALRWMRRLSDPPPQPKVL
ncbi:MAG: pilus assembly protein TadB, partial [Pseudonocardiales bacterium]